MAVLRSCALLLVLVSVGGSWRPSEAAADTCHLQLTLFHRCGSVRPRCEYLGTLTLEIKILHWKFRGGRGDRRTVPLFHGFTLCRSKILGEVGVRTTSVNSKITFMTLQRPKHLSMTDKSTHSLPRHPLAVALGLVSWGYSVLCRCECVISLPYDVFTPKFTHIHGPVRSLTWTPYVP